MDKKLLKRLIIDILNSDAENCESQAGVSGLVVWDHDFDVVAEKILSVFKNLENCS